ncbi:MAG: efflux RND transporter periplasmic adaptor subunit [Gemmatimonadota bacterium]|nr:efflux RND transporter periplasmic adaptor subunit [Gemmatimonadota bacterium]
MPTFAFFAAVVVTFAACLSACTADPGEEAAQETADGAAEVNPSENTVQPFPVEAVVVSPRTLTRSIVASGRLMAIRRTELSAGVSGKALEVPVREGDRVEEGDLLLRLDEAPFKLSVEKAEADLLDKRIDYAVYVMDTTAVLNSDTTWVIRERDALAEARQAFELGEIDDGKLKSAQRNLDAAELLSGSQLDLLALNTGLILAEVEHARVQWELDQTSVHAPFSGIIAERLVEEGQQVSSGETCFELIDLSRVRVRAAVLESDLGAVGVGHGIRISVTTWPGEFFEGRISRIHPTVDEESGTAIVEAELANPGGRLKPGMFAEVLIEGTSYENRIAVPDEAIVSRDERTLVFVIQGGRAQWSYVTLGQEGDAWREVTSGVSEGDTVAVTGNITLAHDVPVRVRLRE